MTETEPEYDANERDSWYALAEFEAAICPECGNFIAVCSTPDGAGDGLYITQRVCYVTAVRKATERRVDQMHGKAKPGADGALLTDGVLIGISLTDDDSDDVLGLAAPDLPMQQTPGDENQPN